MEVHFYTGKSNRGSIKYVYISQINLFALKEKKIQEASVNVPYRINLKIPKADLVYCCPNWANITLDPEALSIYYIWDQKISPNCYPQEDICSPMTIWNYNEKYASLNKFSGVLNALFIYGTLTSEIFKILVSK